MSTVTSHIVKVGGKEYTLQRFRGLKAIMAMAALTRLARDVPNLLADAARAYAARNMVVITEPMAKLPRWEGFTTKDFDAAEKRTGKREIELPAPITQQEQVMAALPALLEEGRKEVIRLMALLIIPNADLMEADKTERVEEALDEYRDILMYEAEIDELAELVLVAQDVIQEQLSPIQRERMGNLARSLWKRVGLTRTSPMIQAPVTPMTSEEDEALTQQMLSDDAPTSRTDSPPPTDGTDIPLSTGSRG